MTGNEVTTVVTNSSNTQDTKLVEKNDSLISFLSVFFSRPPDRDGDITSLLPANLTNEALEMLSSTSTISNQAGQLVDFLTSLASDISAEKHYLSKAANLPHLS